MLDASVPARGLVDVVTVGRTAAPGCSADCANASSRSEKSAGMANCPYALPVSSWVAASAADNSRRSNFDLSIVAVSWSMSWRPVGPASSLTTTIGKWRMLVVGLRIPPRYSPASADSRASVTQIGTTQNRTVRGARGMDS